MGREAPLGAGPRKGIETGRAAGVADQGRAFASGADLLGNPGNCPVGNAEQNDAAGQVTQALGPAPELDPAVTDCGRKRPADPTGADDHGRTRRCV